MILVGFDTVAQVLSTAAALAALVLSVYTYKKQQDSEQNSYLILRLELEKLPQGRLLARTCLENKSVLPKTLTHVILLICPFDELPEAAFNNVTARHGSINVTHMRDFPKKLNSITEPIFGPDRILIPLDYYTIENSEVADEILTFDIPLDISTLTKDQSYSARLILYGPRRLHRVVQRAFFA